MARAKPTYLGLLNAIAVAEGAAEAYLRCWADTTDDPDVRRVIRLVAVREGEHALAFEKRIVQLGYELRPGEVDTTPLEVASSTELSDREKFERLGLGRKPGDGPDVFAGMFADTTIDIATGALLGRYIAEERDSGRRLRACYRSLVEREPVACASVAETTDAAPADDSSTGQRSGTCTCGEASLAAVERVDRHVATIERRLDRIDHRLAKLARRSGSDGKKRTKK